MDRIDQQARAQATEQPLRQLFMQGLKGDNAAHHAFLKDLSAHVRAFLRSRLQRWPDDVEDRVRETLLSIYGQRHTYSPARPLTAWVHAIDRYKRMRPRYAVLGLALPVAALWLLTLLKLFAARPGERAALIFGKTWQECPQAIAVVSIPALIAALWAVRGLAPTHLALAGAAAGLFAGAAGALASALHCPELEAAFLAAWYVLGMLIPTAVGSVLGPRLLRS